MWFNDLRFVLNILKIPFSFITLDKNVTITTSFTLINRFFSFSVVTSIRKFVTDERSTQTIMMRKHPNNFIFHSVMWLCVFVSLLGLDFDYFWHETFKDKIKKKIIKIKGKKTHSKQCHFILLFFHIYYERTTNYVCICVCVFVNTFLISYAPLQILRT